MKAIQRLSMLLLGAASVSLASADAHAGNCDVEMRPLPSDIIDIITVTCKRGNVQATTGTVGAAAGLNADGTTFKLVTVDLHSAKVGSGSFASASGMTSAGTPIAGCSVTDFIVGVNPKEQSCSSAVRWSGTIFFPES